MTIALAIAGGLVLVWAVIFVSMRLGGHQPANNRYWTSGSTAPPEYPGNGGEGHQ